jgi:alpha-galactosidase
MILASLLALPLSLDNGVASLPRMGWSSFNFFGCRNFNESIAREIADALVESGLRDLGFNYLHLDNGALNISRDESGRLQENRTLFPSGLRALSDYLHARGLRLGVRLRLGSIAVVAPVLARSNEHRE